MEVDKWPRAGEMTSRVEFFENTTPVSDTGTVKRDSLTSLGKFAAKRIDGNEGIDNDDRLVDLAFVTYQLRFNTTLFGKGGRLVIRDFDGDYDVRGPLQILGGRNRYMQCKAVKRG